MKTIGLVSVLALLSVAQANIAKAQTPNSAPRSQAVAAVTRSPYVGNPFYEAAKSRPMRLTPQELGQIVACDLDPNRGGNPNGTKIINVAKCGRPGDRAFATPLDYLAMLPTTDPDSGVKGIGELPFYFDSLIETDAPSGKYGSACMKYSPRLATKWRPEANCLFRAFNPGERAWRNPRTNKVVFLQDCTNPVDKPEQPDECGYINYHTREENTVVRINETGPDQLEDACWGLKRPGMTDFEAPWQDECPSVVCDGRDIAAAFNTRIWRTGSYGPNAGLHVLRVPKKLLEKDSPYRVFFCIENWKLGDDMPYADVIKNRPQELTYDMWLETMRWANAYNAAHSNSLGVQWFDYLPVNGQKVATIYYDVKESAANNARTLLEGVRPVLYWQWNVDWRKVNAEAGQPVK